jgi:hypothetical protein
MKLLSRCPHCLQTESIGTYTDTQRAHSCPSCGLSYVPHRHLFVADPLTEVTVAVRDEAAPSAGARKPPQPPSTLRNSTPERHWAWAVVSILMLFALGVQIALHHRDLWAAQWPASQAALQILCKPFGCRLQPPELLDDIQVVSSGFDQQHQGDFVFALELQHPLPHRVATPAMELTLTDAQDRALVRKILLPEQLGLGLALPPGDGITVEARFTLDPELQNHISGFRVELFYP